MINDLKKGTCKNCSEIRILNKKDLCIFCTTSYSGPGTEIKNQVFDRYGGRNSGRFEIKSKTGDIDENLYLRV